MPTLTLHFIRGFVRCFLFRHTSFFILFILCFDLCLLCAQNHPVIYGCANLIQPLQYSTEIHEKNDYFSAMQYYTLGAIRNRPKRGLIIFPSLLRPRSSFEMIFALANSDRADPNPPMRQLDPRIIGPSRVEQRYAIPDGGGAESVKIF